MTAVGELERQTQRRVIRHFRDQLGYRYLGDWHERDGNRNIETRVAHPKFLEAPRPLPHHHHQGARQAPQGRRSRREQDPLRREPRGLQSPSLRRPGQPRSSASTPSQFT